MSNYNAEQFEELYQLTSNPHIIQRLKIIENQQQEAHKTYKERLKMKNYLSGIRKEAPARILTMMNNLAEVVDSGDREALDELFWYKEDSLVDLLGDMLVLCNETEVLPAKKNILSNGEKLDRATILARANDPNNLAWDFCGRCSRPMRTSWIKYHQENAMVCKEIKSGRSATLKLNTRHDTGQHIQHISLSLAGAIEDSDEETDCQID